MSTTTNVRSSAGALTLPAKYYASPAVFQYEQKTVFPAHWSYVGHIREFESVGSFKTVTIGNDPIVVVRSAPEKLAAFYNVCRHRGTMVEERSCGVLNNGSISCPYHAWRYDMTGKLVAAPNMQNVDGFDAEDFGLIGVDVCEKFGFVFVRLNSDAGVARDYLDPLQEILRPWDVANQVRCGKLHYQVNANWKLLFLNYSECYHCPIIHPALSKLTPYKSASNELVSAPVLGGPMNLKEGVASLTESGDAVGPIYPALNVTQKHEVRFFTIFPTMFVSPHPDYFMIHRILPQSCSQTSVSCEFYAPKSTVDSDQFDIQSAMKFWDTTNRQDWKVSEMAQTGISSSGYRPGPYSNLESVLVQFDRYYMSCMCGFENE
jgi:glycine betaine catabolism A